MTIEVNCPTIAASAQGLVIHMPGGVELSVMTPEIGPTRISVAKNLLTQANAALAPLTPFFNVLDAVIAVKDALTAIPRCISNLSPGPLLNALPVVNQKINKLLALLPQLSVPILVRDVIEALILSLNGIIDLLEAVLVQEAKIAAAATKASEPGNAALAAIVICAQTTNDAQKAEIAAGMAPLNRLIGVLNLFLKLIGQKPLPNLASLPANTQDAIDQLQGVVDLLEKVRKSIPIP